MRAEIHAVVLAAGRGARLGALTESVPKALLPLGDVTIVERLLDQLARAGLRRATVVHGWRGSELVRRLGRARGGLAIAHERNGSHATTGSAWSMLAAAAELRQGRPMLLLHGDVVCDDELLARVLGKGPSTVAIDGAWRRRVDGVDGVDGVSGAWHGTGGEEVLASHAGGRLTGIRRAVEAPAPAEATGQFVGVSLLAPDFARGFVDFVDGLGERARAADYELPLLGEYAASAAQPCTVTDVAGLCWFNVNRPEDLEHARRHVCAAAARS